MAAGHPAGCCSSHLPTSAALRPSKMSMTCPVAASTAAHTQRRRASRDAERITVSSSPSRATGATRPGSPTTWHAQAATADHTVAHATPSRRAVDATPASTASRRAAAHCSARQVRTRRGAASSHSSVHVHVSHPAFGHHQMRLRHRTSHTPPSGPGASRSRTSRRPFERARTPHAPHKTLCASGVCTHSTVSPPSTRTRVISTQSALSNTTEPASTTSGLPSLGLFNESQESARPLPQRWTLTSPKSQLR